MDTTQWTTLLKQDVVPALGCTEPVCVALCAAYAGQLITGQLHFISVQTNAGIYKNGMSAGIPNCPQVGLPWAAAIGSLLKNPQKQLQLLENITPELLMNAAGLIEKNQVSVRVNTEISELFVRCTLHSEEETVTATIQGAHTNLVHLEKNGHVLVSKGAHSQASGNEDIIATLKNMTISQIRGVVEEIPVSDLDFLMDGVKMNEELAAYSESISSGVGIADALRRELGSPLFANDLLNRILTKVASAAESRLDGCPLPTMSSSGAGTKGLVVTLPVSETAKALGCSREKTLRALAFAHLLNRYINAWVGKLSPMCSCVMASSTAASAAMAYLLEGTDAQIGYAIRNMSGTVTGMICDGGKVGCALKAATGSAAAWMCALTAVRNAAIRPSDGICAETPEQCIQNMGRIGIHGMSRTDVEILSIMTQKNASAAE
ncbi:MAG: serine dehydratase subunit alpha family protein [Oscillospiraceae bacterium]|nr:serine dehydratase subunit alpha family protein [Oscillospiraceae bacterium]